VLWLWLLLSERYVSDINYAFTYNHISSAVLYDVSEEPNIIRDKTLRTERTVLLRYLTSETRSNRQRSMPASIGLTLTCHKKLIHSKGMQWAETITII